MQKSSGRKKPIGVFKMDQVISLREVREQRKFDDFLAWVENQEELFDFGKHPIPSIPNAHTPKYFQITERPYNFSNDN